MGDSDSDPGVPDVITFPCHHCGTTLRIPAGYAGLAGSCPMCRERVVSPAAAENAGPPVRAVRRPLRRGAIPKTPGALRLAPQSLAAVREELPDELPEATFSSAWSRRVPQRREPRAKTDLLFDGAVAPHGGRSAFERMDEESLDLFPEATDAAVTGEVTSGPEPAADSVVPAAAAARAAVDPVSKARPAVDDPLFQLGLRKPYIPDSARVHHRKVIAFTLAAVVLVVGLLYFTLVGWETPWTFKETPALLKGLEKSSGSGGSGAFPFAPR